MEDGRNSKSYGPFVTEAKAHGAANDRCLQRGYKYAVIENGKYLWCHNEYPSLAMADDQDKCQETECANDPGKGCGGEGYLMVLKTKQPPLTLVDCEKDEKDLLMLSAQHSSFSLSGPVKGWSMRATSKHPQVVVSTNDVLSICENPDMCKFNYDKDLTPVLESVSPLEGIEGDEITITFASDHWKQRWIKLTAITIGGVDCPVDTRNDRSVVCKLGRTPAGVHDVIAHVTGVGASLATIKFKSLLKVTKVTPSAGSVKGGTILVIEGKGFAVAGPDNTITVGDVPCVPRVMDNAHCEGLKYEGFVKCDVDSVYGYSSAAKRHYARTFDFSNYDRIECVVGAGDHKVAKLDLSVAVGDEKQSLSNAFEFSIARTPIIKTINPDPVARSVPIVLHGSNLAADPVVDKQWYMNIWGFYERFPNVSVFLGEVDVENKTYDRQMFGKNLCFMGDVSTEDRMGKNQQWSESSDTQITCTVGDVPNVTYPVHVYIHGKGFAQVQQNITVGVVVSSIEPSQIGIHGGVPITIHGSGFSRFKTHNRVDLGEKQSCAIVSVTHTKIVCLPSAAGKEQERGVTVHVTCGNIAFCNSEPQPSNDDVKFSYRTDLTPEMTLNGNRPIFNAALEPATTPGAALKMNVSIPPALTEDYKDHTEGQMQALIKVWLGDKEANSVKVTKIDHDENTVMMEAILPGIGLGHQHLQVEMTTGRSAKETFFVFPHVGTPDVTSTGLGGGLVVTLSSPGIGGWIDQQSGPRQYATPFQADSQTWTESHCYNQFSITPLKRKGPMLNMTELFCRTFCDDHYYYALKNGDTCLCSNSPPRNRPVIADKCDKYCTNDFKQEGGKCGGKMYINVFERCCRTDVYLAPEEWPYLEPLTPKERELSTWASLTPPRPGILLFHFLHFLPFSHFVFRCS